MFIALPYDLYNLFYVEVVHAYSYYLCLCTAQDVPVEVCISFGGETLVDPYINVDWNVS